MVNDILPPSPNRPLPPVEPVHQPTAQADFAEDTVPTPQSPSSPEHVPPMSEQPHKSRKKSRLRLGIISVIIVLLLAGIATMLWYQSNLTAVAPGSKEFVLVTVDEGATLDQITSELADGGLLRSGMAFKLYAKFNGQAEKLQAGAYRISKGDDVPAIISHISTGKTDSFDITFLPGGTVSQHKSVLKKAGFSAKEVEAAFNKTYSSPLFADKPAEADLEGYIYGETYNFPANASVEQILERSFAQFEQVVNENKLVAGFKKQGLSLYEGITLASIVQREVPTAADQKTVAGVFYNRLAADMNLGSDVTYQYIADKTGVDRDPNLDSPYNTRIKEGLPPGPIASPGASALIAVAQPTKSDYLYFLSGDDDVTYYGKNSEEHEANIKQHCQKKCQIL